MAAAELIVDVHHHYMPEMLFDRLAKMAGGKRIVTNEISLTLHPSRKDLEAHIQCMDEAGITVSILTDQVQVMGAEVARALNDGIAEVEKKHPSRFRGCIHLPVHEPEAAKRELERGMNELGLRAVALLACHLDVQLDNPVMNPLFETIQKSNLPIVIHPQSKPTGSDTLYNLDRCVFRPLETTQAIVRVMNSVLPRYPELRFIMPHLGGGTSSLKGRMMAFFETEDADIPARHERLPENPGGAEKDSVSPNVSKNSFSVSISIPPAPAHGCRPWRRRSTSRPPIASCSAAITRWNARRRQI